MLAAIGPKRKKSKPKPPKKKKYRNKSYVKLPKRKRPRKPKKYRFPKLPRRRRSPTVRRPSPEVINISGAQILRTQAYGGPTYSYSNTMQTWQRYRREYSGLVTANYKLLKKRKQKLPFHPFHSNVRRNEGGTYVSDFTDWNSGFQSITIEPAAYHDQFSPSAYGINHSDEVAYWARARLARAVNEQKINLGVAFAERKQTAELIEATAKRLLAAARALRRGDLLTAYRSFGLSSTPSPAEIRRVVNTKPHQRIANHWNEIQFGWKPLLNDVYGAAETLASHVSGDLYHTVAKGSAKGEFVTELSRSGGYPFNGTLKERIKIRYLAKYRLDSYARAALSSTGIDNPLSVAWEVVPNSFVIDWFLPVSNFLKNLTAFDGFELLEGSKSTIWDAVLTKDFSRVVPSGNVRGFSSGSSIFFEVDYRRDALITFPGAILPSFRNPLSKDPLWTTLTSMALLSQLFSAKPTLRL